MITLTIPQLSAANRKNNSSSSVHSQTTRTKRCINAYAVVRSRHNFCRLLQPLFSAWLGDSTGAGYGSRVCTVCGPQSIVDSHCCRGATPERKPKPCVISIHTLAHLPNSRTLSTYWVGRGSTRAHCAAINADSPVAVGFAVRPLSPNFTNFYRLHINSDTQFSCWKSCKEISATTCDISRSLAANI